MVNKTYGNYTGTYYRYQSGDDDKLKKRSVNAYSTSQGRVSPLPGDPNLNSIGAWVTTEPFYYCRPEWEELMRRMTAKCRNAANDALVSADLYYARDTGRTAVVYAKKVLRLVRALKRRDVRQIKFFFSKYNSEYGRQRIGKRSYQKALTELPEAWLTLQFVINPLVKTVKAMSTVLDNPLVWNTFPFPVGKLSNSYTTEWGFWGDKRTEFFTIKAAGEGQYRFVNPNTELVARLGLTDVIGAVYDIIPWSWAVDYFSTSQTTLIV